MAGTMKYPKNKSTYNISRQDNTKSLEPIFIVGHPRSGTTMLAAILARHSEVAIPPETNFFLGVCPSNLLGKRERIFRKNRGQALIDELTNAPMFKHLNINSNLVLKYFNGRSITYRNLFISLLQAYSEANGKRRFGEKSPWHLSHVDTIIRWYSRCKIVSITRDGRDVVLSCLKAPFTHSNIYLHCIAWRKAARLSIHFKQLYKENFLNVKYENILLTPEKMLKKIDHFCGIEYELNQLDPSISTGIISEHEKKWKSNVEKPLDPSRISAWKTTASEADICIMNTIMGKYLDQLGYIDTSTPKCTITRKIKIYVHWFYSYLFGRLNQYILWQSKKIQRNT